jgi:Ca2+-transporting ATPase
MLLECCSHYLTGETPVPLTDTIRSQILKDNADMASQGLRVLGFAYRTLDGVPAKTPKPPNKTWSGWGWWG